MDRLVSEADPAEYLDLTSAGSDPARTDQRRTWEEALESAHERLDEHPASHPEVQHRILSLVELDVQNGSEVAQEAALKAFAELAMTAETRESIEWFFHRKRIPVLA